MVVALGQFAQLPVESFAAGVVLAAGAPAIPAPIPEALDDDLQLETVDDVDRAALAQRHVMRRIKGLGGEIAQRPGDLPS